MSFDEVPDLLPENAFVFVHIPKTGGTSIVNAFRFSLPEGFVVSYHTSEDQQRFRDARDALHLPPAGMIAAHLPLCVIRDKGYTGYAMSVIRNPLDQIVSLFRYLQSSDDPTHKNLKFESPTSFLNFLREENYYYPNIQCRLLGREPNFESSLQSLSDERLIVVSIDRVDSLIESLTSNWPEPLKLSFHNVTPGPALSEDDREVLHSARDLFEDDLRLYEYVQGQQELAVKRAREVLEHGHIYLPHRELSPE